MGMLPRRTMRARKRQEPERIIARLRSVDVPAAQGKSMADAIRSLGVTKVMYDRWKHEYGGLKRDQVGWRRPT
jgi:transposase